MTIRGVSAAQAHAIPYSLHTSKLRPLRLPGNIDERTQVLGLLVLDALLLWVATGVALWGRSQLRFLPDAADVEANVRQWAEFLTLGWLVALGISGAYQTPFLGAGNA